MLARFLRSASNHQALSATLSSYPKRAITSRARSAKTSGEVRQDWKANDGGQTLTITAAAYNGKPIFFRAAPLAAKAPGMNERTRKFSGVMFVIAVMVCGIGGCFLARRNMRRGRGDRQGAFRVAAFIFIAEFVGWVLAAHFVPDASEEYTAFIGGCGEALYVAGFMWILYMAIEPYVRRRWPEMLISWTRVLSANFYDSRVGRDVMVGALGGAAMAIIQIGVNALPAWLPVANILPIVPSQLTLSGPTSVLAAFGVYSSVAVQWALATVSFLLVARTITRRDCRQHRPCGVGGDVVFGDCLWLAVPVRTTVRCCDAVFLFRVAAVAADSGFFAVVLLALYVLYVRAIGNRDLCIPGNQRRTFHLCRVWIGGLTGRPASGIGAPPEMLE
jgi:hypothetical protein